MLGWWEGSGAEGRPQLGSSWAEEGTWAGKAGSEEGALNVGLEIHFLKPSATHRG